MCPENILDLSRKFSVPSQFYELLEMFLILMKATKYYNLDFYDI